MRKSFASGLREEWSELAGVVATEPERKKFHRLPEGTRTDVFSVRSGDSHHFVF